MEAEKITVGLIGVASSAIGAGVVALINRGKREQQFADVREQVVAQANEIKAIDKRIDDKVSFAQFKEEISEIHGRISRTQREQAESLSKLSDKVDRLTEGVYEIKGMLTTLPEKMKREA
jgi:predicted  nucleic acid-binding Zn-ribbon protein